MVLNSPFFAFQFKFGVLFRRGGCFKATCGFRRGRFDCASRYHGRTPEFWILMGLHVISDLFKSRGHCVTLVQVVKEGVACLLLFVLSNLDIIKKVLWDWWRRWWGSSGSRSSWSRGNTMTDNRLGLNTFRIPHKSGGVMLLDEPLQ